MRISEIKDLSLPQYDAQKHDRKNGKDRVEKGLNNKLHGLEPHQVESGKLAVVVDNCEHYRDRYHTTWFTSLGNDLLTYSAPLQPVCSAEEDNPGVFYESGHSIKEDGHLERTAQYGKKTQVAA